MEYIYQQVWINLPQEVREHLIKIFNIQKTGIAEIRDQSVISDGFTNDDLKAITKERMSAYVGSPLDTGFMRLWEITLSKVNFELHPPMFIGEENVVAEVSTTPKYCDYCVSTQGRHRKGCPKYK